MKGSLSGKRFTGLQQLCTLPGLPITLHTDCNPPRHIELHGTSPISLLSTQVRRTHSAQTQAWSTITSTFNSLPLKPSGKVSSYLHIGSEHGNPPRKGVRSKDHSRDIHQLPPERRAGDWTLPWMNISIFALEQKGCGYLYTAGTLKHLYPLSVQTASSQTHRDAEQHSLLHQAVCFSTPWSLNAVLYPAGTNLKPKEAHTESTAMLRHCIGCVLAPRSKLHSTNTILKLNGQCHRKIQLKNTHCKLHTTKSHPIVTVIWCSHVITIPFVSIKQQFRTRKQWQRDELASGLPLM